MMIGPITPDKNIVLCDVTNKDVGMVAVYLEGKGFENLRRFNVDQWTGEFEKSWVAPCRGESE